MLRHLRPIGVVAVVAVGDGPKIAATFAKYGTVEMFDQEGKPTKSGS